MLTDDDAVEKVLGDQEFLNNLKHHQLLLICHPLNQKLQLSMEIIKRKKYQFFRCPSIWWNYWCRRR